MEPPALPPPSPYAAHRSFVAPAQPSSALIKVLLGFIAIETLYYLTTQSLPEFFALFSTDFANAYVYGNTRSGLLTQLYSFALLGLTVTLVARILHRRSFGSLIGPLRPAWRGLLRAFIAVALVFVASELLPPYWSPKAVAELTPPLLWLGLLPLSLGALLVQTGSEELMYRGYLQQQIAARFPNPWVWMILPNLLFASAHFNMDTDLQTNAQYMLWAFTFGLAASDLTARAGNIGPAIGFHMANNAYAFLFFGEIDGPDSGLALLLFEPTDIAPPFGDAGGFFTLYMPLMVELGMVAVFWLAARYAIRAFR